MSKPNYQRIPGSVPRPSNVKGLHSWRQEGNLRRLWMRFHNLPDEDGGMTPLSEAERRRAEFFLWRNGGKAPEGDY